MMFWAFNRDINKSYWLLNNSYVDVVYHDISMVYSGVFLRIIAGSTGIEKIRTRSVSDLKVLLFV